VRACVFRGGWLIPKLSADLKFNSKFRKIGAELQSLLFQHKTLIEKLEKVENWKLDLDKNREFSSIAEKALHRLALFVI
jgi:hypothetical protein